MRHHSKTRRMGLGISIVISMAIPSSARPPAEPVSDVVEASAELPSDLVGQEWSWLPTNRKVVALTFDGGSNAGGVRSILGTLARKDASASFFLTGAWVELFPSRSERIAMRYAIGNHTFSHPDLTKLSFVEVRAEIRSAQRVIIEATGVDPRPLFRFPYGARDPRTLRIVNGLGYGSIRWTVDTLGWKGTRGGGTAADVVDRVVSGLRPGAIILMHLGSAPDGSTLDADALPEIIRRVRAKGYRFVRIDRFLANRE